MQRVPSLYGRWLREARRASGLSQAKLAERSGVHRIHIAYIETGRTQVPRAATHERLSAALGQEPPPEVQDLMESGVGRSRVVACSFCRERPSAANELVIATHRRAAICIECLRLVNSLVACKLRQRRSPSLSRTSVNKPPSHRNGPGAR